jgi:hypothetical protein
MKLPKDWPALNFDHNAVSGNNIVLSVEAPPGPVSEQSTRSTPEYLSPLVFRQSALAGGRMATGQLLANHCISPVLPALSGLGDSICTATTTDE